MLNMLYPQQNGILLINLVKKQTNFYKYGYISIKQIFSFWYQNKTCTKKQTKLINLPLEALLKKKKTYVFQNRMKKYFGPNVYILRTISTVKIVRKNQSALSTSKAMKNALTKIMKSNEYRKNLQNQHLLN